MTTRRCRAAAALAALLAGLLGAAGCEIAKPELPRFTTTLTVPLGAQRLTATKLAQQEAFLGVDADSLLAFSLVGDSDTLSVAANLSADLPATTVSAAVGEYSPAGESAVAFDFGLHRIYPASIPLGGQTVIVPPFVFDLVGDAADLPDIVSARVATGRFEITAQNGLPVPVSGGGPPNEVSVTLTNPATGAVLATVTFPAPIAAGETAVGSADLAGVVLPDSICVRLHGGSPGSASPVQVPLDARLRLSARLRDLRVAEATAVIGAQHLSTTATVALPDTVRVIDAQISEGTLSVDLVNDLAIPCQATLSFPEIEDAAGRPLTTTLSLAPRAAGQHSFALAGGRIRSPDAEPLTALRVVAEVTSPGSGAGAVALAATDALRAQVAGSRLRFGAVTGVVPERRFAIAPLTQAVDFPPELSGISLTAAALTLTVDNTAAVPARLALTLGGRSTAGATATLDLQADIPAGVAGDGHREIVFDGDNSGIVGFLNLLPQEITLTGTVTVGGDGAVGTVHPGDRATVGWRLDAPLNVVVQQAVISGDAQPVALDAEARANLAGHLGAVRVITDIANHLPLGVELRLLLGDDPATLATAPQLVVGPLTAAAGRVPAGGGAVTAATTTRSGATLTPEQAQVLTRAGLQALLEVTLPGSNGQAVALRASDWVSVTGCLEVEIQVTPDK